VLNRSKYKLFNILKIVKTTFPKVVRVLNKLKFKLFYALENYNNWAASHKFYNIIFLFYITINSFMYLNYNVVTWDEAWFLSIKYEFVNMLAYGNLYWILLKIVDNTFILRLLSLICMLSIPVIIYKFGNKFSVEKNKRYLIIFLWFTFPASWWYGKLIGTELYSLAISFTGLYLCYLPIYSNKHKYFGIIMMGIATGIKLSFIVFPFFYFSCLMMNLYKENKPFIGNIKKIVFNKSTTQFFILSLCGFIIGSPSLLFRPIKYFENLQKFSASNFYFQWKYLFDFGIRDFWGTIFLPSLTGFSLSLPAILYLLYLIFKKKAVIRDRSFIISFFFALCLSALLVFKASLFFTWYFYPIITLMILLFYSLRIDKKYLIIIVSLNLIINSPMIFGQLYVKTQNIIVYYTRKEKMQNIELKKAYANNKYNNLDIMISIKPEGGSASVHLKYMIIDASFKKPTFFAIHEMMMVSYYDNSSIYGFINDCILTDNRVDNFKKAVFNLEKENYQVEYLGEYKSVHSFIVVPKNFFKK
jgi:hypothetical protein